MSVEQLDTLIVGGGQAGLAISEHLSNGGVPHLVVERHRIAERWRSERWDSLVANGPAWHDRFPNMAFPNDGPDDFACKENVADYLEAYAAQINAPIRCGVEVLSVEKKPGQAGFHIQTSDGEIEARNIVAATGPFQRPIIPPIVPATGPGAADVLQMHSVAYKNPGQLPDGAVLVVGAGSSGGQIADELLRAGRQVYLSLGPHDKLPRRYRARDFVWWLGVLGMWEAAAPAPGTEHVTISVSGARGGETVDFRQYAARGMTLVGRTNSFKDGVMQFGPDAADNVAQGHATYLAVLDAADAYIARHGLDLPEEPKARIIGPDPDCLTNPILDLDLKQAGVTTIIWATGFAFDYNWLKLDVLDDKGRPIHQRGVTSEPGIYFLGLPWQSRRGSSFIWGVWHDAKYIADQIAIQNTYRHYQPTP